MIPCNYSESAWPARPRQQPIASVEHGLTSLSTKSTSHEISQGSVDARSENNLPIAVEDLQILPALAPALFTENNSTPQYHHDAATGDIIQPQSSIPPGCDHLATILLELSASPPRTAPMQDRQSSEELTQWLASCFKSYKAHFHHRWHIITAPTYDFDEKSYGNASSVTMIGSYFLDPEGSRNSVLAIHNKLVDNYFQLLVRCHHTSSRGPAHA